MEGITWDYTRNKLYVAMSEVRRGMEDNAKEGEHNTEYEIGGPNHIKVDWNECGCGVRPTWLPYVQCIPGPWLSFNFCSVSLLQSPISLTHNWF